MVTIKIVLGVLIDHCADRFELLNSSLRQIFPKTNADEVTIIPNIVSINLLFKVIKFQHSVPPLPGKSKSIPPINMSVQLKPTDESISCLSLELFSYVFALVLFIARGSSGSVMLI